MFRSADYWERRYQAGKNSGAGSYGRLANFKADFLNRLISETGTGSVIDFGCGDGNQLALLDPVSYIGVDVSRTVLESLKARFADQPLYSFVHVDDLGPEPRCDLAMSNDVIYQLVEDAVFESYMRRLFLYARHHVAIYSSNKAAPYSGSHIRHRCFTDFIEHEFPDWRQVTHVPNPYPWDPANKSETSFADFYVFAASDFGTAPAETDSE